MKKYLKNSRHSGLVAILLLTLSFTPPCYAAMTNDAWWVNTGILGLTIITEQDTGKHSSADHGGVTLLQLETSLNWKVRENLLITARYLLVPNMVPKILESSHLDNISDWALMAGWIKQGHRGYISFSTGLAYTVSTFTYDNKSEQDRFLGIPLEIQAFWTPFRYFGLGIVLLGNLNHAHSFGGALLEFQLGRLKPASHAIR